MDSPVAETPRATQLLPLLPLRDTCLFPGASLSLPLDDPLAAAAVQMALRTGGTLLVVGRREDEEGPHALQSVGTVAVVHDPGKARSHEQVVEVDGVTRARLEHVIGLEVLVAEVTVLPEGDPGDEGDEAVEAIARYLHAHPDLRSFLEARRRSTSPLAWVSLACQHLPVSAAVRQSLLDASAAERCARIGRGLEALLRKEQQHP
jgi:Lon protease-like protein